MNARRYVIINSDSSCLPRLALERKVNEKGLEFLNFRIHLPVDCYRNWNLSLFFFFIYLLLNTPIWVKQYNWKTTLKQQRMHLYKHTINCYTYVKPSILNSKNCFIKAQTANVTVNVGKYSKFYVGDLKLNNE